jgi:hypothetical protein
MRFQSPTRISLLRVLRHSAFILCLWSSVYSSKAQLVHITAELETVIWDSYGPAIHARTWTNECLVGTNTWLITGDPFGSLRWSSGTNSALGSERILESVDGNPGQPPGKADLLRVSGNISWLAFCSGSFLKQNRKGVTLPSDLWKEYLPASWQTSEKITLFDDELGLPERIVLRHKDQPVLQYRVTLTTNVLDWTFPLEFYLAQYIPAGTNAWELHLTAKGRIVAIGEEAGQPLAPERTHSSPK